MRMSGEIQCVKGVGRLARVVADHKSNTVEAALWHGPIWLPEMNFEVYRAILSAHCQENPTKMNGLYLSVQLDSDLKPTTKAT